MVFVLWCLILVNCWILYCELFIFLVYISVKVLVKVEADMDFLGSPVVKNPPSNAGMWIQSLVEELRSHTLWGK